MAGKDQKNTERSSAPRSENKSNRDGIYITIIVILILATGFLGWRLSVLSGEVEKTKAKKEQVAEKKDKIKKDLENMLSKYDSLSTDNKKIKKEMKEQKEEIKELMDKVDRYQYSVSKLKEEKEDLRDIMQGYVRKIDSLNKANQKLKAENKNIKSELDTVKSEKEKLKSRTDSMAENLEKASVLKTANLKAQAIRFNLLGNPKVTDRASRTEKFKTCFTINRNEFAKEGKRTIYIRIITPKGQVLAEGKDGSVQRFEFDGVRGQYTLKKKIEYKGKEMDMCLYWNMEDQEVVEGKYGVKVYENKNLIGNTTLTLE